MSTSTNLTEVFGKLSKWLRDIEDLPLKVVAVQPVSPGNVLVRSFMLLSAQYVLTCPGSCQYFILSSVA